MNPELDSPPFEIPKVDLYLEMEKLAVGITKSQYQRLIELADGMGALTRGLPYRKFRPFDTRKFQVDTCFLIRKFTFHKPMVVSILEFYSVQGQCQNMVEICV